MWIELLPRDLGNLVNLARPQVEKRKNDKLGAYGLDSLNAMIRPNGPTNEFLGSGYRQILRQAASVACSRLRLSAHNVFLSDRLWQMETRAWTARPNGYRASSAEAAGDSSPGKS